MHILHRIVWDIVCGQLKMREVGPHGASCFLVLIEPGRNYSTFFPHGNENPERLRALSRSSERLKGSPFMQNKSEQELILETPESSLCRPGSAPEK